MQLQRLPKEVIVLPWSPLVPAVPFTPGSPGNPGSPSGPCSDRPGNPGWPAYPRSPGNTQCFELNSIYFNNKFNTVLYRLVKKIRNMHTIDVCSVNAVIYLHGNLYVVDEIWNTGS